MLVRVTFYSGDVRVAEALTTQRVGRNMVKRALGRPAYGVAEWAGVKSLRPPFLPMDRRVTRVSVEEVND